ncbi:hypothetical protein [Mucilaginibacter lacusdianchii]|uniref:hypothetical protein n=1 Tax=Mucilaginibacter lacusdianchii TaxID=2684211 RepID=UPI00131B0181|nr:hypothetical protein [Mucilaginibacter sp. JXJ CY 39]
MDKNDLRCYASKYTYFALMLAKTPTAGFCSVFRALVPLFILKYTYSPANEQLNGLAKKR